MSRTVEELEQEITQLPKSQLKKFRIWYENFDSEVWDEQIEEDVKSGKLDSLAESAIAQHKSGRSKKL